MKLKQIFRLSLIGIAALLAVSCSGLSQPSPEEVAEKIKTGETLDASDFDTMLDYLEDFCDAAEECDDDYDSGRALGEEYPYFMAFAMKMDDTPQETREEDRYTEIKDRFMDLLHR